MLGLPKSPASFFSGVEAEKSPVYSGFFSSFLVSSSFGLLVPMFEKSPDSGDFESPLSLLSVPKLENRDVAGAFFSSSGLASSVYLWKFENNPSDCLVCLSVFVSLKRDFGGSESDFFSATAASALFKFRVNSPSGFSDSF